MALSFYEWLMEQVGRDDPIGDLAGDVKRDPNFPADGERDDAAEYLQSKGGSSDVLRTFEEACNEFNSFVDPDDFLDEEDDGDFDEYAITAQYGRNLIPAWFSERMMLDTWLFGLLTTEKVLIVISSIDRISQDAQGTIWVDVTLSNSSPSAALEEQFTILTAPTSRDTASINASHIIAAFELADT
jgi:uncharacterized protein YozE (UPF0346 family)